MAQVRPLPVRVKAYAGEPPRSFFLRLCAANKVTPQDVWLAILHHDSNLRYNVATPTGARYVAKLGGLPSDFFASAIGQKGGRARPPIALLTGAGQGELLPLTRLCVRCTRGEEVDAHTWFGPICLRHRLWVQGRGGRVSPSEIDTRRWSRHNSAQRCLNGTLRSRGIGYASAAVAGARDALRSLEGGNNTSPERDSPKTLYLEIAEFPEVVCLAAHLTSPAIVRLLLDARLRSIERSIIIAYVAHSMVAGLNMPDVVAGIATAGREVVLGRGFEPIGPYTRRSALPEFARGITASYDRIRMQLLRFVQTPRLAAVDSSASLRQGGPRDTRHA